MGCGWLEADFPILPTGAEAIRGWSDLCVPMCGLLALSEVLKDSPEMGLAQKGGAS